MHTLLVILLAIVLWVALHRYAAHQSVVCRNCGTQARCVTVSPRNLLIELLLWFCGLVPGVIYTLWCNYVQYEACVRCKSREIIPVDSPVGRELTGQGNPSVKPDGVPISEQLRK